MLRKAMLHGPSTLTVSLPSKWARRFRIRKGDELQVAEQGSALRIAPARNRYNEQRKLCFDAEAAEPLIRRMLVQAYQHGFGEVRMEYKHASVLEKIRSIVAELVGFEIVEHGRNYCLVKEIAKASAEDLDRLYRRTFLLLNSTIQDFCTALETQDLSLFESVRLRDMEINKLSYFCMRQLAKDGSVESQRYLLLYLVERIGDEYRELAEYFLRAKADARHMAGLFRHAASLFAACYEFTFKRTIENALKVARQNDRLAAAMRRAVEGEQAALRPLFLLRNIIAMTLSIQELQLTELQDTVP